MGDTVKEIGKIKIWATSEMGKLHSRTEETVMALNGRIDQEVDTKEQFESDLLSKQGFMELEVKRLEALQYTSVTTACLACGASSRPGGATGTGSLSDLSSSMIRPETCMAEFGPKRNDV